MATVRAKFELRSPKGMLIAKKGRLGQALRGYKAYSRAVGKVAVKWKGRRVKIYWHELDELEFIDAPVDIAAYVAQPPDKLLNYPPLPAPAKHDAVDFGRNLRAFRQERGFSQAELASRLSELGLSVVQTTVSNWERRAKPPGGLQISILAEALDVPVMIFFINYRDCDWLDKTIDYLQKVRLMICGDDRSDNG